MGTKLTSRKFWVCIGIALTGIGSTIAGIVTGVAIGNETLSTVLTICGMALTGLGGVAYELSEAMVDSAAAKSDVHETLTQVSASSSSRETVEQLLIPKPQLQPAPEEQGEVTDNAGGTA